ncbi:MAG: hypothetical protein C0605_03040 [Hyphomicrobiales bacterium]|nr:MAG: hypothetical protein C0605_03040 [Hyphomicrobiales bacterium]
MPASSMVTRVRIADTEQDIDQIMPLACELHREDLHRNLKLDRPKLRRFFMRALNPKQPNALLIAERAGRITGFLYATIGETFFGPSRVASCMLFYVLPQFRGSVDVFRLLKACQLWAKMQIAEQVSVQITFRAEPF